MEYIRVGPCPQNMPLGPKTAIFFDWDGTLADSMPLCIEQIRRTLEELNLPPQDQRGTGPVQRPHLSGIRGAAGHPRRKGGGLFAYPPAH